MPQNTFFSMNLQSSAVFWSSKKWCKDTFFHTLHSLSLVIFATATVVAFVLLGNSRFNYHCCTQHEAPPTRYWPRSDTGPLVTSCMKDYQGHSLMQTSFTELPNRARHIGKIMKHKGRYKEGDRGLIWLIPEFNATVVKTKWLLTSDKTCAIHISIFFWPCFTQSAAWTWLWTWFLFLNLTFACDSWNILTRYNLSQVNIL